MKKKVWKSIVCCASMILSLCMFTVHASAAETQAPEPDVYQLSFKAGEAYNGSTKADVVPRQQYGGSCCTGDYYQ